MINVKKEHENQKGEEREHGFFVLGFENRSVNFFFSFKVPFKCEVVKRNTCGILAEEIEYCSHDTCVAPERT